MTAPCVATLVLDTNAWLDLLVFDDPVFSGFEACVASGAARIVIDGRAFAELARVLAYPGLAVTPDGARHVLARVAATSVRIDIAPASMTTRPLRAASSLPRCRDRDDQIFLEIAAWAAAAPTCAAAADAAAKATTTILTRDADLLRMARRMSRDHGVAIVRPGAWRTVIPATPARPATSTPSAGSIR